MLDGILLERAGVPSAAIVTDVFEVTGRAMAEQWGLPYYRFLAMPHPIANLTEAELDQRAPERLEVAPFVPPRWAVLGRHIRAHAIPGPGGGA